MLHPADTVFMRRLIERIHVETSTRVEQMVGGSAFDFADYRHRCGYIQALDDVRQWCREIAETDDDNPTRTAA